MKITKIISYIHLLGCIGWLIFGLVGVFIGLMEIIKQGLMTIDKTDVFFGFAILLAIFLPSASGIYFFIIRRRRQWENIRITHAILKTKIISYIHFLGCIGWLVFGIWGLTDCIQSKYADKWDYLALSAILATTACGTYLFVFQSVFWKQDLVNLWKRKQIVILWTGIFVIVAMCLFPPFVSSSSNGFKHGYAFMSSDKISVFDGRYFDNSPKYIKVQAHIDLVRLIVQCAIVALITGGLLYTLKDKKKD